VPSLPAVAWSRRTTAMTAHGQPRTELFDNGLQGIYQFDPATGRPTWLAVLRQLTLLQSLQYAYDDPQGGLSRQTNTISGITETFAYDALSRLDSTTRTWPGGETQTVDYQYDAIGNLVVKNDYSRETTYGAAGRSNPAGAGPHAIVSYLSRSGPTVSDFRYDSNGNQVGGGGRRTTYDAHDKPVSVTEAGSTVRHFYGPNVERYKRITSAGTTYYLDKLHERIVGAGTVTERDYVGDKIVITRVTGRLGIVVGERAEYLHPDRLGSTDTLTDSAGLLVRRQGFDPFGGPRDDQWRATPILANTSTDRGFTGHEQVDDVHLVHMGGRAYDYRLGRFLSVDPFAVEPRDMQSLNAYSYARNNPTGRIDPTGYADEEAKITRIQTKRVWVPDPGSRASGHFETQVKVSFSDRTSVTLTPAQAKAALAGFSQLRAAPEDTNRPGQAWRVISAEEDEPVVASTSTQGLRLCAECQLRIGEDIGEDAGRTTVRRPETRLAELWWLVLLDKANMTQVFQEITAAEAVAHAEAGADVATDSVLHARRLAAHVSRVTGGPGLAGSHQGGLHAFEQHPGGMRHFHSVIRQVGSDALYGAQHFFIRTLTSIASVFLAPGPPTVDNPYYSDAELNRAGAYDRVY
jgi:RHS repeat-associated protein